MRVALGSDHAGFEIKELIKNYLAGCSVEIVDVGTASTASVDYPDYALKVAERVRDGRVDRGILICGTGVGMCIAANKIQKVRAALVWDVEIARLSRQHNDANILCLPGRIIDPAKVQELVRIWLETPFKKGRHGRRIEKITALEQRNRSWPVPD